MALNKGHRVSVENLRVVRITRRSIVMQGDCGERFYIVAADWPKLRTRINRAARIAKKQELSTDDKMLESHRLSVIATQELKATDLFYNGLIKD